MEKNDKNTITPNDGLPWEPAGVKKNVTTDDYGEQTESDLKGGQLKLELEDIFNNGGIMGDLESRIP